MPLAGYGVLAGSVVDQRAEGGTDSPHYQIRVRGGEADFRVAVNVLSQERPAELLYAADENFRHPVTQTLPSLPDGFTPLASQPGGMALDFIRANLFDRQAMQPEPASAPGPDNDLADKLDHFVRRAAADPAARLYAFGQRWGPEAGIADKIFGFLPGNGVHDIHMNQGNSQRFRPDDGVWQDGGLLVHFPAVSRWVGIFLAFQSQAWHTDDATGHAIEGPSDTPTPDPQPAGEATAIRILAAMVNPVGPAPEHESVLLVNASPSALDLTGWRIADRLKRACPVPAQTVGPGELLQVRVTEPAQLSNQGGLITVLDAAGLKMAGVAYTAEQARQEGWTLTF